MAEIYKEEIKRPTKLYIDCKLYYWDPKYAVAMEFTSTLLLKVLSFFSLWVL